MREKNGEAGGMAENDGLLLVKLLMVGRLV